MYDDSNNVVNYNLGKGEKLLWTGRPKTGLLLRSSDTFIIPFSLMWGGFAVFWESTVVFTGAPFFFKLWGIPFVVMGLYITVGRFFLDARKRKETTYGITDQRIIIRSGIFSKELKSLNIRTLSDVSVSEKSNGTGAITFGPTDYRTAMMSGVSWPGVKTVPQFEFIDNVQEVYNIIMTAQRASV